MNTTALCYNILCCDIKRKGYNPAEGDVPVILAIHNTVNERGNGVIVLRPMFAAD